MQILLPLETPDSNTGLKSHSYPSSELPFSPDTPILSIDSLTLIWDFLPDFDILPLVKKILQVEFDFTSSHPMRVGVIWDNCYRGSMGCLYMFRATELGVRYRLAISGKACASVPIELFLRFIEMVYSSNPAVECSRIDICLDDYKKHLTYDNLCAALDPKVKNYSGFHSGRSVRNYDDSDGWTVYLGSRESEHFVRVYNKSAESKGRIDAVRWESEFKGDKADLICRSLASSSTVADSLKKLQGYLFGNFNFIHKVDRNLERCDKLKWWSEFLNWVGFGRCNILVVKPVTSIESRVLWIKKQVEKSLALLSRAFGLDDFQLFMDECLASGSRRLRRLDDLLVLEYLNSQLNVPN